MNATPASGLLLGWPTILDERSAQARSRRPTIRATGSRHNLGKAVQYHRDGHLITFAPTGSGKGVSVIIPNLLHYSGPTIVIDPKGENFAVTARYRQALGHRVLLLDPFNSVSDGTLDACGATRDRLNPLDLYALSNSSIENAAQMIAGALSVEDSTSEPFWDLSARKLLAGVISMEMEEAAKESRAPRFRNLITILYADDPTYTLAVKLDTRKYSEFVVRSISGGFLAIEAKDTRAGILATAQSYLSILISEDLLPFIDTSTIGLKEIQRDLSYTLYVVIPPNKLDSHAALLRIWMATLLYSIMEREEIPEVATLFMLDECANLGELEVLRKAVTLLRGYGLKVWMFFQDLAQLQEIYGVSHRTIINNCGVMQVFGMARRSAAQPLSSVMGKYTTGDLQTMDKGHEVLSIAPGKTSTARLMRYYADTAFDGRYDRNPLIRTARSPIGGGASRLVRRDLLNRMGEA